METFNKTGIIEHKNNQGKTDGSYFAFVNGKMILKGNYVNGLREGWFLVFYLNGQIKQKEFFLNDKLQDIESEYFDNGIIKSQNSYKNNLEDGVQLEYYPNGKIKDKGFSKNDKAEGAQYSYYENGKVKHVSNLLRDKLYGDEFYYYENGKVAGYHAYDIKGDKFYLERFTENDSLQKREGFVFSPRIYSIINKEDSAIVLKNNQIYSNIKDLYITFAKPPNLHIAFRMGINHKSIEKYQLKGSTIKIENVFDKDGIYDIEIMARFFNASNPTVKEYSIESTIIKK